MTATIERAIVKGRLLGQVATRNMFVGSIVYTLPLHRSDMWNHYLGDIWSNIDAYLSTGWVAETIEVQHLDVGEWVTQEEFPASLSGGSASPIVANLVAAVLIGKGLGRRLIGRKFFSGLTEAAIEANSLASGALTAFAGAALDYISPSTATDGSVLTPGIVDKGGNFQGFASGFVSSLLGTMRRRKPGLGI